MQVHYSIAQLPLFDKAVVTIGTFDGVHVGHRQIIDQLTQRAAAIGGESVIITFHPHPRVVVQQQQPPIGLLTTLDEKLQLLARLGVDHTVVVPFDDVFAQQSAQAYVKHFLWEKFKPNTVIIGYDHKFGKGRSGDFQLLQQYGERLGFAVQEISEQVLNEVIISSTRVRKALLESDITAANTYLGYPYFFNGVVVTGNKLGRTIGYPTANLHIKEGEKLVPGNGVYAVTIAWNQRLLQGMMNIGVRPTVDGSKRTIEVNIFDFNQDIYDEYLTVNVYQRLRGEIKFSGLPALQAQLAQDAIDAKQVLQTVMP
ncbi:MAG: bifunctional riboflavin kinase/FAD synthetase [Chitinophagaceae bacterium]